LEQLQTNREGCKKKNMLVDQRRLQRIRRENLNQSALKIKNAQQQKQQLKKTNEQKQKSVFVT